MQLTALVVAGVLDLGIQLGITALRRAAVHHRSRWRVVLAVTLCIAGGIVANLPLRLYLVEPEWLGGVFAVVVSVWFLSQISSVYKDAERFSASDSATRF